MRRCLQFIGIRWARSEPNFDRKWAIASVPFSLAPQSLLNQGTTCQLQSNAAGQSYFLYVRHDSDWTALVLQSEAQAIVAANVKSVIHAPD